MALHGNIVLTTSLGDAYFIGDFYTEINNTFADEWAIDK